MFNGKCKVWREGDTVHATMTLPTPTGPIEWHDSVKGDIDDAERADRQIRAKARFVAGFFPTREMVGAEHYEEAEELYRGYLDPATRPQAEQALEILVERMAQGDDNSEDVGYAARRMAMADAEKIGWGWGKKFFRRVTSIAKKPIASVVFPPLAAYHLVNAARKSPLARKSVTGLAKIALAPVTMLPQVVASVMPKPPPPEQLPQVQEQAREALANVNAAAEVQERAEEQTGDPTAFDPPMDYSPPADLPYPEDDEDDVVAGALDLYYEGAMQADLEDEVIAGLFSFVRKIGRTIDPTGSGAIGTGIRSAISHVPGVGPELAAGLDLLGKANAGSPEAVDKIQTIKDLAGSGVPKAQEALKNLKKAQGLQKGMQSEIAEITNPTRAPWKWPGFRTYYAGARSAG